MDNHKKKRHITGHLLKTDEQPNIELLHSRREKAPDPRSVGTSAPVKFFASGTPDETAELFNSNCCKSFTR